MMTEEQHDLVDFINQEIDKWDDERRYVRVLEIALAALTQPASPALKLPDPFDAHDAKVFCAAHGVTGAYELASQMANYAVDNVVRFNAPHTAPIEPICATGGAEWVKCSERMPKQYQSNRYVPLNLLLNERTVAQGGFDDGEFWIQGVVVNNVTRWMPLPAAPIS